MFKRIAQHVRDMATIKTLCEVAETHARRDGSGEPGAEHFVLAALDLPDGTGRRAFTELGADAADFSAAIKRQHVDALSAAGVRVEPDAFADDEAGHALPSPRLYKSQPSAQRLFSLLTTVRKQYPQQALSGAHVIVAASRLPQGVVARTLKTMGVEATALAAAAAALLHAA